MFLLATPVLSAAANPPAPSFQKQIFTDQYYCDGITAGARPIHQPA
jgi:hypothetical protein